MPTVKSESYLKPGANWSPVFELPGGFGKDFAFAIYQRTWFDNHAQRLSCAALNPTGAPTNLFFHLDIPMFVELAADGSLVQAFAQDTINFVVRDNGEWRNKRSLMEFLFARFGVADTGAEHAGVKPLDLVMAEPVQTRDWETQACQLKATWSDFEFILEIDLPARRVAIREIDPKFRAPLLRYFSEPESDVAREADGVVRRPKEVIDAFLEALAQRLSAHRPRLSLSARTLRFEGGAPGRRLTLQFRADRNNAAGRYVGVAFERRYDGVEAAPSLSDLWRTRNTNGGFGYELSRDQQREIIVDNLAAFIERETLQLLR